MSRGADGSRSVLDVVVAQWPTLVFLPAVFVLIAVLVLVTAWWDRRDAAARAAEATPPLSLVPTPAVSAATRPSAVRSRGGIRRPWLRRSRCTCSWHDVQPRPVAAVRAHEDAAG